ncbi:MAG: histidinol-phosphatase HisJ family protein [Verrucomicrobiae bacterium]|nr:histidinol-phosphatase HisJ family protein [Verrucomicrobiae bacterium]
MPLPADYHMHTPLCRHAAGEPVEYAARAIEVGLTEIGFSDHSPMRQDNFDEWRMNADQLSEYVEKVEKARADYPQLKIRLALEVDYIPGHEDWIRELSAMYPWDYLIGSVHYVSDDWEVDHPDKLSEWRSRDKMQVWGVYFDRLTMAAESRLFDIIGHADLVKKFCFYPDRDCTPLFERFLHSAAKNNTAIELNTAGLRKECREIYPARHILNLAFTRGVRVTFGSDAHKPDEVGMDFEAAIRLARSVGYTHWSRYAGREFSYARL